MQGRRLDTTRFLDDRSEVKTSSTSHFLPFYEKHTDPILGTANVEGETPRNRMLTSKKLRTVQVQ